MSRSAGEQGKGDCPAATAAVLDDKLAEIDSRVASCERAIDIAGDEFKRIEDALQGGGTDYPRGMSYHQDKDKLLRCLEAS